MEKRLRFDTIGLVALGVLATSLNGMVPLLVGALIESLGFSRIAAGQITAIEFLGVLGGTVIVLSLVGRISRRQLAFAGIPLWIACNLLSMVFPSYSALLPLRFGAGIGMGVALATVMGAIASRPNPVRLFATLMVSLPLFLMVAIPLLQRLVGSWGAPGAYGLLAAMSVVAMVSATQLPTTVPNAADYTEEDHSAPPAGMVLILPFLAALLMTFVGFSGCWAYVVQVGKDLNIDPTQIAWLLGISQTASIAGSFLAGMLNERLGHTVPAIVALAVCMAGAVVLAMAGNQFQFALSLFMMMFGWLMSQPFLLGLAARLDSHGKVATAATVAQTIGMSAGPFLAALLIEGRSAALVGYFCLATFVAALFLLFPASSYVDRRSRNAAPTKHVPAL